MSIGEKAEYFHHDGFKLAFRQAEAEPAAGSEAGGQGAALPILLIHGFSSSGLMNWVATGWFETLAKAGHRVIAIDNRGHGLSDKAYGTAAYEPELMADDAAALLDYLNIGRAHIMGYSMGARISAYLALRHAEKTQSVILGGLGQALIDGGGDWHCVRDALLAPSLDAVSDPRGRMFRSFADMGHNDLQALAACAVSSKKEMTEAQVRHIKAPALVAIGTEDGISGAAEPLAALLPQGSVLLIPDKDHMQAVGDKLYKQGAVRFFAEHEPAGGV